MTNQLLIFSLLAIFSINTTLGSPGSGSESGPSTSSSDYTQDFPIERCTFQNTGKNPFFSIEPGTKTVFEGKGEDEATALRLEITVLDETQEIQLPDIQTPIVTRVIEERESEDGELVEVSRNFFAICDKTNDVYYFGEDVQIFEEDGSISNEGQWRAGVDDAKPGIIMPGTFLLGSKYYQEVAPGVAEDRAENTKSGITIETELADYTDCVEVTETTPLEVGDKGIKIYCPEVGLVQDEDLKLIEISEVPETQPQPEEEN